MESGAKISQEKICSNLDSRDLQVMPSQGQWIINDRLCVNNTYLEKHGRYDHTWKRKNGGVHDDELYFLLKGLYTIRRYACFTYV